MNKINKRTLIIIAALAIPVVLLVAIMYSGPAGNNAPTAANKAIDFPYVTLDQARINARNRLAHLEKMTPEQWENEQKGHPIPLTLEQSLENAKNRLKKLEAMTPDEWEAQPYPKPRTAANQ